MSLCLILLGEGTALDIFKYPNFSNLYCISLQLNSQT